MIKKAFLISLLCLLYPIYSQGQQKKLFTEELSVGGSFGVSLSSVSFSPTVKQNMLLAYNAGFTARWITQPHCGIQVEVNYAQKGWDEFFDEPEWFYTRRINYIDIPFMSHFYFGKKRVRAFLNLGPQIGFAFSDSYTHNLEDIEDRLSPNTYAVTERTLDIQHKFGWGLCGGSGLEIRTGIGIFQLEGRYYYSLGDIFGNGKTDDFGRSAPQVITVKLSYLMPILTKTR